MKRKAAVQNGGREYDSALTQQSFARRVHRPQLPSRRPTPLLLLLSSDSIVLVIKKKNERTKLRRLPLVGSDKS
jgi:hypothetical protein